MKSKNYLLWSLAFAILFSFFSCKPKESAYKAAYDAAKAREIEENQNNQVTQTPSTANYPNAATVQQEKVTALDGAAIQQFSVVVGSFMSVTNARSERERMAKEGYNAFLAQNENGMYRVIVATFNDKAGAAAERDRIKEKYYPRFQDVWILDKQ